jgi:hypothetical protein
VVIGMNRENSRDGGRCILTSIDRASSDIFSKSLTEKVLDPSSRSIIFRKQEPNDEVNYLEMM